MPENVGRPLHARVTQAFVGGQDEGADAGPSGGMSGSSTRPPCRIDLLLGSPPVLPRRGHSIIFDGAHNPVKLATVVATLREMLPARQFPWILALKHGKDLNGVLDVIAPVVLSSLSGWRSAFWSTGCRAGPGSRRMAHSA
jgi:hypothetical protein